LYDQFRPIKPRSPHLNGKVERYQKTDKAEFYATVDLNSPDLDEQLGCWQHYDHWARPHGAHNGRPPIDKYRELSSKAPFWDEVEAPYDRSKEDYRVQNHPADLKLYSLKRNL